MTTQNYSICEDNIARLNAFLDEFPDGGLDPDFDDPADYLDREFAGLGLICSND